MCLLSNLVFPLEKNLSLPPLSTLCIKCSPCGSLDKEIVFVPSKLPFEGGSLIEAEISSAKQLTQGEGVKTVIELMLETNGNSLSYLPGDTIGILPQNPEDEVAALISRLNLPDCAYKIEVDEESQKKKSSLPLHLPSEATAKYLFMKCLDIRALVKKSFLRSLIDYTLDEVEKRRLQELCSKEGSGEYNSQILNKRASIMEVLEAFPSCQPPLSLLLQHLPRLQPRPYSIASSPLEHPCKLRIIFNVVYDGSKRRGICSGWLYDISRSYFDITSQLNSLNLSGSKCLVKVPIYLRKPTKFRIPDSSDVPMIMIGPGTGVSPFIGFLEHRKKQLSSNELSPNYDQSNWLFYGCRYPESDEIYRDVFLKYDNENICKYLVTYSRLNSQEGTKTYVQDTLKEWRNEIVNQLLSTDTCLFICGDGLKIGQQILFSLVECFKFVKDISEEEAKIIVSELETNGRILKDIWM